MSRPHARTYSQVSCTATRMVSGVRTRLPHARSQGFYYFYFCAGTFVPALLYWLHERGEMT